ncbi:MAG: polysaccharide deacetylase family protein [Desulfitobacteriaceae bacterium]
MKLSFLKVLILFFIGTALGLSVIGCSSGKLGSTLVNHPPQENPPITIESQAEADKTPMTASYPERTILPENTSASQALKENPPENPPGIVLEKSSKTIPVLYYHSVMVEPGNELRIPPAQFETQMRYLSEQGYNVVNLDQLYKYFYEKGILPEKPVVITFDDGYEDNYTNVFPILKKYGYTATVFVVTGYVNGKGFMSWKQLQELGDSGWQIEGHTLNHPSLVKDKLDVISLKLEITEAKDILEKRFGRTVKFFAYPNGDYNADVIRKVKEAGYLMAFTTERGWADRKDPMLVHRVYCFANMGIEEFARRLNNPQY